MTISSGVERMGGRAKTCWLTCSMGCDGWQRNCRKNNSRTCGCGCSGVSSWDESIRCGACHGDADGNDGSALSQEVERLAYLLFADNLVDVYLAHIAE